MKKKVSNSIKINSLSNDLFNSKIHSSQKFLMIEKLVDGLTKESVNTSKAFMAIIDTLSDVLSIPVNILAKRFMFYCGERDVYDNNGNIKGEISIVKYNF